jgi:hypothetical protein
MPTNTDASRRGIFKRNGGGAQIQALCTIRGAFLGGLPRKIGLAKDSEPLAGQDRPPAFLIIEVECHS